MRFHYWVGGDKVCTARLHRKLVAHLEGVQSVARSSASRTSPIGVSWGGEVAGSCGLQIGAHILPVTIF